MAASTRQSQFHRHLSFLILVALTLVPPARAGDVNPSDYASFTGDKFFLLSETTFGSEEIATVRLEAPGRKEELESYSGVDVRVYRVKNVSAFLKKQKNLHRPVIQGNYSGEGVENALNYVWDSWYKKSRLVWQRVVSSVVRERAVEQVPELRQQPPHTYHTQFRNHPQFRRIAGMEVVDEFRYPIWQAKPVAPPSDVNLRGSSSNRIEPRLGDVRIPIGKRKPGLYVVEAIIGTFRANTLLFVSDTVAITKISGQQLLTWSVRKKDGVPVPGTQIWISDGVGTLGSGSSAKDGVYLMAGKSLERSYVIGTDPTGGVFVSENFYYDSEIYGAKVYTFTDRPLYRPGDTVQVKVLGREFKSSRESTGMKATSAQLLVLDSNATPLVKKTIEIAAGIEGGQASFRLPAHSTPGGYNLSVSYGGITHSSSFRVAHYVKPHFEIDIAMGSRSYTTHQKINGRIRLLYPNGEPVREANVEILARKQRLTMVEGEVQHLDRFPIQVLKKDLISGKDGSLPLELPEVTEPTRYLLSVRGVDQASYRVTANREILVQAGSGVYSVRAERQLSSPGEKVRFFLKNQLPVPNPDHAPATWELTRLQDQSKLSAETGSVDSFEINIPKGGAYSIAVKDKHGNILGTTSHWVSGPELAGLPGSISIVLDRDDYEVGQEVKGLLTFSEKVSDALLTIERDQIEQRALLSEGGAWIRVEKVTDQQWRFSLAVREHFSPNVTFSVAYVANSRYFFENKGIKVAMPRIQLRFQADKLQYVPGETVNVSVQAEFKGKPIEAALSVAVVDEMIYVLQPEIAPDISEFFYHLRRNQVRTSSSLSFHSFDAAVSAVGKIASVSNSYGDRSLKLRERPRREEKDTAFWAPSLRTDREGRAKFSFLMPDSITRWRITGRAISSEGAVGQRTDHVLSSKDFYLKWTGSSSFRKGDRPRIAISAFNLTDTNRDVVIQASGAGVSFEQKMNLKPGSNVVLIPVEAREHGTITTKLIEKGQAVDQLDTTMAVVPQNWLTTRTLRADEWSKSGGLLARAFNVRLSAAPSGSDVFFRAVDQLAEYPYGCVEQTASRLLPLSLAYLAIQGEGTSLKVKEVLENRLVSERLRLVQMAGPEARFGWWGNQADGSLFMTAYAYYADWVASSALRMKLPESHWEHVLEVYKQSADAESYFGKALSLWLMSDMGLPVKSMVSAVGPDAVPDVDKAKLVRWDAGESEVLMDSPSVIQTQMGTVLLDVLARKHEVELHPKAREILSSAREAVKQASSPMGRAISLLDQGKVDAAQASDLLQKLTIEGATIDRAISLLMVHRALGLKVRPEAVEVSPPGEGWSEVKTVAGRTEWRYTGAIGQLENSLKRLSMGDSSQLIFETHEKEESRLPVSVTRRLYRLQPKRESSNDEKGGLSFSADPVADWKLKSSELYLDEITVTPQEGKRYQFGFIEAGLPSGGEVEDTSWGVQAKQGESALTLSTGDYHKGDRFYGVPVRTLSEPFVSRRLVRFSKAGSFMIPPARFFRMYAPGDKAYEGGGKADVRLVTVE